MVVPEVLPISATIKTSSKPTKTSAPIQQKSKILKFQGSGNFRQRLILSTLSGRSIRIENIGSNGNENDLESVGLKGSNRL